MHDEYTLDCAAELGDISTAEHHYFHKICDSTHNILERLSQEANKNNTKRSHMAHLRDYGRMISDYAHEAIPELKFDSQYACYFSDFIYRKSAIRASCECEKTVDNCQVMRSIIRSIDKLIELRDGTLLSIKHKWNARIRAAKNLRNKKKFELKKAGRVAFRRSYDLALSVMGKEKITDFIKNKQLDIQGQLYTYRLTNPYNTLTHSGGHGQTSMTILTHAGDTICNMCIYSANCTLLDHLVSIYAHIKTGEELEILQTGNVHALENLSLKSDYEFISGRPYVPPADRIKIPSISVLLGKEITEESMAQQKVEHENRCIEFYAPIKDRCETLNRRLQLT